MKPKSRLPKPSAGARPAGKRTVTPHDGPRRVEAEEPETIAKRVIRTVRKAVSLTTEGPKVETPEASPEEPKTIERPEHITKDSWEIARHWLEAGLNEEQRESILTSMPKAGAAQIREALTLLAGTGEAEDKTEPAEEVEEVEFFAEPEVLLPDGAIVLYEGEFGENQTSVILIRRPTLAETPVEAEAWAALHDEPPADPTEVAESLDGDREAWTTVAKLLGDEGVEGVVYATESVPEVPEGVEASEEELLAWHLDLTGDENKALETLTGDGDEADWEDAQAILADIRQWPVLNVPVFPEKVKPDLVEGNELDGRELAAWYTLVVEEDARGAMAKLIEPGDGAYNVKDAALAIADLKGVSARTITFEVTVEEMRQRAGLGLLDKAATATPTTATSTVATPVAPKVTVQQVIGALGIAEAGGYKDVVIEWAVGQSGAETPEGVGQWLAAQRPDAVNAVEFSGVKPQRQLKARDFFRTLRSAAVKKYPDVVKVADEEWAKAAKKTAVEPIRSDVQAAVAKGKLDYAVNLTEAALDVTNIGDKRAAAVQIVAETAAVTAPPPVEPESEEGEAPKAEPFLETTPAEVVTDTPAEAEEEEKPSETAEASEPDGPIPGTNDGSSVHIRKDGVVYILKGREYRNWRKSLGKKK